MTTKKSMLLIAGAAGIVGFTALAGLAIADNDRGGEGHGKGRDGRMYWHGMIERYDANKDGKITQDEINNNRQSWYAEFDLDKDGKLTLVEFEKLWLKARQRMMVREFQYFDANGDGGLTILEYKEPMEDLVAERDRNGDGALSREDRARGDRDDRGKQKWRERINKKLDDQQNDEDSSDRQESDDN